MERKRCAIYTRKSIDEGLDQEFNTLDAQREAGESYIASQKSNGWVCLPERYDDGGYSGSNMERPALKKLLADAKAGLIDIIIVYKIDRLSRSLCDFAELSKTFDEYKVSFVSVTQEINTSTSAGRMMLNILMTFAQYEREIIAERIRDKMAASRKRGQWMGGQIPYGYTVENKKLLVAPAEAEIVKRVFQRFCEIHSPKQIAAELNHARMLTRTGKQWDRTFIQRMLSNHTYIGEVDYKGSIFKGEHAGIIDVELWERVRRIISSSTSTKEGKSRADTVAPLKGILRCGHCNGAMNPTYGQRGNKKYFYYICNKDDKRSESSCPVKRIPAGDIEKITMEQIAVLLKTYEFTTLIALRTGIDVNRVSETIGTDDFWNEMTPGERNRLLTLLIEKIIVTNRGLEFEFKTNGLDALIKEMQNAHEN